MSKVQHPAFPEIVREVADVGEWVAAGWRPAEQAEDKPQPKPRQRRKRPAKD